MADRIRKVSYRYVTVDNKAGEGARVLTALKKGGANLLAVHAFPSGGKAQVDVFTEDAKRLEKAAQDGGLKLSGEKKALYVEGDDRVGAMHDLLDKLGKAGINVTATDALASGGRYAAIVWVDQKEVDRAAKALGA
jgi:hypothetical protein